MATDFKALREPHRAFPGSVEWRLTPDGLLIEGEIVPRGSGGAPKTVKNVWKWYERQITDAADEYDVPFELIVATICTESRGDRDARRVEPGFTSDQATPSRVSVGLMQTLISTARSALKNNRIGDRELRDPATSIRAGTAYIASQASKTKLDPPKVACAYNAGGVYEQTSLANRWRMRQFPIGTGAHADRFVAWFNDCFIAFDDLDEIPTPSFIRATNA